jgi:hypothetical protein
MLYVPAGAAYALATGLCLHYWFGGFKAYKLYYTDSYAGYNTLMVQFYLKSGACVGSQTTVMVFQVANTSACNSNGAASPYGLYRTSFDYGDTFVTPPAPNGVLAT